MPLSNYKIIDLTRVRSGPTSVKQLSDWGAKVIKIEAPPDGKEALGGDRDGFDFQNLHRNKRSINIDLKSSSGKEIFYKLVEKSDVVVENYRPNVKFRLGIDYEILSKINPKIILASISGFGQTGPYSNRPGFDQIAQGMGGLMSITGEPGKGPMRVGIPIADLCAGIFCAQGILLALLEREISGKGQWVTTSLLESQIQMLDFQAARYLKDKGIPVSTGNDHPTTIPTGVFPTSDGFINLAIAGEIIYERLCKALDAENLIYDKRFNSSELRLKNKKEMNTEISKINSKKSSDFWIKKLNDLGCPAGPIYSMDELFSDPQIKELNMSSKIEHKRLGKFDLLGQAIKMNRTKSSIRTPAPEQGEHTNEILEELGYSKKEIEELRSNKVI